MDNWNNEALHQAARNLRRAFIQGTASIKKSDGYELKKMEEVYLYLADVVLKGEVTGDTVREWTKPRSKGPREGYEIYAKRLENFLGVSLLHANTNKEKGVKTMRKNYDGFTKDRVFTVHAEVLKYLDERCTGEEVEDAFWKLQDVLDSHKVAVPKQVYSAIQGFIDQYLEEDLFGGIFSRKERSEHDLSELYNKAMEKECPNPECGEDHVKCFQLKNIYDEIARCYIQPVLMDEEEEIH